MVAEMTYDIIVLSYLRDATECVAACLAQKPSPVTVWVWHNAPSVTPVSGAVNVFCGRNLKCRARHALGLLSTSDAVVFVDDDVILKSPNVCASLMAGLTRHPDSVVGIEGRRCMGVSERMYWGDGQRCSWREAPVSVVKGKVHAVRRMMLPLAFSHDAPEAVWTEDDITLNAAFQMATGKPSWTIGGVERAWIESRSDGKGNEDRPDHFARRDAACRYMAGVGWNPVLWKSCEA